MGERSVPHAQVAGSMRLAWVLPSLHLVFSRLDDGVAPFMLQCPSVHDSQQSDSALSFAMMEVIFCCVESPTPPALSNSCLVT